MAQENIENLLIFDFDGDKRIASASTHSAVINLDEDGHVDSLLVDLGDRFTDLKLGNTQFGMNLNEEKPTKDNKTPSIETLSINYGPNVPNYLRGFEGEQGIDFLKYLASTNDFVHLRMSGPKGQQTAYFSIRPPGGVSVDDCLPKDVIIDGNIKRQLRADGYKGYVDSCEGNYTDSNGEDVRPVILMLGFSTPGIQVTTENDAFCLKRKKGPSISWGKRVRNAETYSLLHPFSVREERSVTNDNIFNSRPALYLKRDQ